MIKRSCFPFILLLLGHVTYAQTGMSSLPSRMKFRAFSGYQIETKLYSKQDEFGVKMTNQFDIDLKAMQMRECKPIDDFPICTSRFFDLSPVADSIDANGTRYLIFNTVQYREKEKTNIMGKPVLALQLFSDYNQNVEDYTAHISLFYGPGENFLYTVKPIMALYDEPKAAAKRKEVTDVMNNMQYKCSYCGKLTKAQDGFAINSITCNGTTGPASLFFDTKKCQFEYERGFCRDKK